MERVDFYVVKEETADAHLALACRLAEKAFRSGHSVYIHATSRAEAGTLDKLLWTFRPGSFLPHAFAAADAASDAPIIIGWADEHQPEGDVLINLSPHAPDFFRAYQRVAEPVSHHPEVRRQARDRFRFYREQGYPLQTHELNH